MIRALTGKALAIAGLAFAVPSDGSVWLIAWDAMRHGGPLWPQVAAEVLRVVV